VTRPASKPGTGQQRAVDCARELAEAAATVETLAAYLGVSTQYPSEFFYAAYRAAVDRMRDLLASLDLAGAGSARPADDPPHDYVPAGPVEAALYLGYCRPQIRRQSSPSCTSSTWLPSTGRPRSPRTCCRYRSTARSWRPAW